MATETVKYIWEASVNGFVKSVDEAKTSAEGLSGKLKAVGQKVQGFGDDVSKVGAKLTPLSVAAAALGGAIIKSGMDFESAFAGVIKTVDATDEELAQFREGIIQLSQEIPVTATELAGIAEAAGQLGVKNENILEFTRTMADLGVATNLTSEDAATLFARFANITGMDQSNFDRLGSAIVALGNNSATTEAEIGEMALRLAGAGSQAGLTEPEIVGIAAALSSVGIEAEAGGSAFSRVITNIQLATIRGGKDLNNFAKVAGMSADEFKTAFEQDAAGAITSFITGLGDMEAQGKTSTELLDEMGITELRTADALKRLSGNSDVFTSALETSSQAWNENIALTKEAEQRYATTESKWQILKNTLAALFQTIYDRIQPVLQQILDFVTEKISAIITFINSLPTEVIMGFVAVLAGLAVLGPILLIIGQVISYVGMLISAIGTLIGWVSGVIGAFQGFIAILAGLSGPVGIVIAAVVAIIAIFIALYNQSEAVRNMVSVVIDALVQTFMKLGQAAIDMYTTYIQPALNYVMEAFGNLLTAIQPIMDIIANILSVILPAALNFFSGAVQLALNIVGNVFSTVFGVIGNIINIFASVIKGVVQIVQAVFAGDIPGILEGFKTIFSGIFDGIAGIFSSVFNGFIGIAKGVIDAIAGFFSGLADTVGSILSAINPFDNALYINHSMNGGIPFGTGNVVNNYNWNVQQSGQLDASSIVALKQKTGVVMP